MLLRRYHTKEIELIKNSKKIEKPSKEELLGGLTIKQLREVAEREGMKGYKSMKKEQLIEALRGD